MNGWLCFGCSQPQADWANKVEVVFRFDPPREEGDLLIAGRKARLCQRCAYQALAVAGISAPPKVESNPEPPES